MARRENSKGYVQKRATRPDGWTVAKRKVFLDTLAATCNVSEAARVAGMDRTSARNLRLRDGEFAQLWAEAFEQGEERLREECIARALGQVSTGDNPTGEREPIETGRFDADLAMKLLAMRNRGATPPRRRPRELPSQHDVDAALIARFDALDRRKARLAAKAEGSPADPGDEGQPA